MSENERRSLAELDPRHPVLVERPAVKPEGDGPGSGQEAAA